MKSSSYDAFFTSGLASEKNPLISHNFPLLSRNLFLKSSLLAALFWIGSLAFQFTHPNLSSYLLLITYFLAGTHALIESIEDLLSFRINIDVLMTLAAFLSVLIGSALEGGLLLVLFAISEAMEEAVQHKTTASIESLINLAPKQADVKRDGTILTKSIEDVKVGAHIVVKAGGIIPLDGRICEGTSSVNMAHLTGEPLPVHKGPGDSVAAGSINTDGSLIVEVTATSSSSTIARIIELITEAQSAKPSIQRFFDRVSGLYAKGIILTAFLFGGLVPLFSSLPYLGEEGAIYRALAFLIAASPCALIIALPTAYLSAISSCAKKGVLLKGGIVLDALAKARSFVFDKTGTLTTASLELSTIEGPLDADRALTIAASLEKRSSHPIGSALVRAAEEKKQSLLQIQDFREISGYGIEGEVEGIGSVVIGHGDHIISKLGSSEQKAAKEKATLIAEKGESLCAMLVEGALTFFTFRDTLKKDAKEAIDALKKEGLNVSMLTGDHAASARAVASKLGIENFESDLRPEDKMRHIERLEKKEPVAMFGDGINDAPALARASVGISMGSLGSDTAIEASDIVFLHDELMLGPWSIKKARATMRIVNQNLIFATAVIAGVSLIALFGFVPLWLAVTLHEGGTILVALNGLRLLSSK